MTLADSMKKMMSCLSKITKRHLAFLLLSQRLRVIVDLRFCEHKKSLSAFLFFLWDWNNIYKESIFIMNV